MTEWRPASLVDLGSVERGRSRHRPRNDARLFGDSFPFFQTGDVKAAMLHLTAASQMYSDFGVAQSRVWEPGTTCITIAANIAESAVLGRRGCFPDSVLGFTPLIQPEDAYFVKYLLDVHRERLTSIARGTTQDNLSLEKLLARRFSVPGMTTRRRVVAILRLYDDLIENNRRRVQGLEEMVRAIYREWFVHFRYPGHEDATFVDSPLGPIPEGWEVRRLEEVVGVNLSSRRPAEGEAVKYLDISCLDDRSLEIPPEIDGAVAPGRARRVVAPGDVVWSMVRPNRRAHALLVDPGPEWIVSTGLAVLSPTKISSSLLFETASATSFSDHLTSQATGAAYPAVKPKDFKAAPILVPPPALDQRFEQGVGPQHQLVWTLREEANRLAAIRDLLLPKLVTGQIAVSALDLGALADQALEPG